MLKRRWHLDDSEDLTTFPDAEVHWRSDADTLTEYVLKAVEATEPGDLKLGMILEESLSAAYDLLDAYQGHRSWDPLSFSRGAIEPHEQDQFREPIDAVIDGLRTYGELALNSRSDLTDRWWSLGPALFRRLALHLLAVDGSRSSDEKILWLLERSALYETHLKHETYAVLKVATEKASKASRDQLLSAAKAGPNSAEDVDEDFPEGDRHLKYVTYNLLVWLARVAPGWSEANKALAVVQAANPDFAPRENPDFDKWMTSGTWGGKLPMEPEDFVRSFEENPVIIDELLKRDYSERSWDEPRWSEVLSLVSQVVESHQDLGEQLWARIEAWREHDAKGEDLRRAIIDGWAKAPLNGVADSVLARVATQIENPKSLRSVSRFLLEQVRKKVDSDDTAALAGMRRSASQLWTLHGDSFTRSAGINPNSAAPLYLNSWPGDLARYWTVEVDRRWRKNREDWSGLSDEERNALTQLLHGPQYALNATGPALASQLFFLFAADEAFTTNQLLPLFLRDETAALAWNSYLRHGRYNDKLLAAGLLDSTIAEWRRLDSLEGPHLRSQFFALVASIVSFAGITRESRQALLDQSVLAENGAHEADFAHAVARFLRSEGIDGAEVWKIWLRDHLTARLNGIPRILNVEELTCWADTVPYLSDGIPEAIGLFSNRGAGLGDRFLRPDFPQGALSTYGPILVGHFAERIRNSSPSKYFAVHQVKELIKTMRGILGDAGVEPLLSAAVERGFIGGSTEA